MAALAQLELGVDLPLRALFEAPDSARAGAPGSRPPPLLAGLDAREGPRERPARAALKEALAAASKEGGSPAWAGAPRSARGADLRPARPTLRSGCGSSEQFDPGRPVYHVPVVLPLHGELDPARLRAALDGLVRRHDALRTALRAEDGTPRQLVLQPGPVELETSDLSGLEPGEREAALSRWAAALAARPFDFAAGRFVRAGLARLGPCRAPPADWWRTTLPATAGR